MWLISLFKNYLNLDKILAYLTTITCAALLIYLGLFVRSICAHPSFEQLRLLLFLWQAQSGALLAVLAAGIGATAVLIQTREGRRQAEEQRRKRLLAQRATLPLALSSVADYAEECAEKINDLLTRQHIPGHIVVSQFPTIPQDLEKRFEQVIETCDASEARPLIILIRRLQIQNSRIKQIQGSSQLTLIPRNLRNRLIDAAEIYARCSALFGWARDDEAATGITASEVKTALQLMHFDFSDGDEIDKDIDRRAENGEMDKPWPEY